MNSRPINLILLALNLGLLGTIGYMAYIMKTSPALASTDIGSRVVTNTVTQIAVRKVYPTNFLASLGKLPISWNAIESTNYRTYIANLRAIDCPPEAIRDITLTDVANTVTQIAVRKVYPTNFLASLGKLPISWNAIESTNY